MQKRLPNILALAAGDFEGALAARWAYLAQDKWPREGDEAVLQLNSSLPPAQIEVLIDRMYQQRLTFAKYEAGLNKVAKALPRQSSADKDAKDKPEGAPLKASKKQGGKGATGRTRYTYPGEKGGDKKPEPKVASAAPPQDKAQAQQAETVGGKPAAPGQAPLPEGIPREAMEVPDPDKAQTAPKHTVQLEPLLAALGVTREQLMKIAAKFYMDKKADGRKAFIDYMSVHLQDFAKKHSLTPDYFGLVYDVLAGTIPEGQPPQPPAGQPAPKAPGSAMPGLAKAKVKNPGLHGGKWYRDEHGEVQYGDRPQHKEPKLVVAVPQELPRAEAARKMGRVLLQYADLNKETPDGKVPEAKVLTPEQQKELRGALNAVLQSYGLENWAERENMPGKDQIINSWSSVKDEQTGEEVPGGRLYRLNGGHIHVGDNDHCWAGKFFRDTHEPAKDRFGGLEIKVFIHEGLHGASPITESAYGGPVVAIEEACVEILARKIVREQFGLPSRSGPVAVPRGKKPGKNENAYDHDIIFMRDLVTDTTGMSMDDAYDVLEEAALSYRQKGAFEKRLGPGHVDWNHVENSTLGAVGGFAKHLEAAITEKLGANWEFNAKGPDQRPFGLHDKGFDKGKSRVTERFHKLFKELDHPDGLTDRQGWVWAALDLYGWESSRF